MRGKTVLVTGVGGNVGQGILRNLRAYPRTKLILVGTDTRALNAGFHLCDFPIVVPRADDPRYSTVLEETIREHHVDFLIPSTDLETAFWSENKTATIPSPISPVLTCEMAHDKWKTFQETHKLGIRTPDTFLAVDFPIGRYSSWILKPRKGSGSKGILWNHCPPEQKTQDFIIQKKISGIEYTSAFYFTKAGNRLGPITFKRTLAHGTTVTAQVDSEFNSEIVSVMSSLESKFKFFGPVNLQFILSGKSLFLIEINARFSGTNSIRAHFGFKDVWYAVDEYLFGIEPIVGEISQGKAVRYLEDIILHERPQGSDS